MNVKARIDRLEKARQETAPGMCACQGARIVWGDDGTGAPRPDPGAETCPVCGRVRQTWRVQYGDPESEALA
jgi:hypothetical protein